MSSPKSTSVKIGAAATPPWIKHSTKPYYRGDRTDNHLPSGTMIIIGDQADGELLTATNSISDVDGLGTFTYQWENSVSGNIGTNALTYTLATTDVGDLVRINWSYTDGLGRSESGASAWTGVIAAFGGEHTPVAGDGLLLVDFENGDMSLDTNADGFSWGSNNRTSIVTEEPGCGGLVSGDPTAIYNNGVICNGPQVPAGGGDWLPYEGNNSLRVRYPAGIKIWAEQRFNIGTAQTDIWYRWWTRVPVNYEHRNIAPNNKKFFAWWMDGDSSAGTGGSGVISLWYDGAGGSYVDVIWDSSNTDLVGGPDDYGDPQSTGSVPFISYPSDQGRWMQCAMHLKTASDPAIRDGTIDLWRRWDGETNFTNYGSSNTRMYPNGSVPGWLEGYIMGFDNSGFATDTEWFVDNFEISTTPLV